jgi:exopolyphosphatase / guanosine-5'-triphosphate,3'-diphosphate pyrophosphatase
MSSINNISSNYACIDLGSNSFRLLIAKIIKLENGYRLEPIFNARKSVALAAGLNDDNVLDNDSISRAIEAFLYFNQYLKQENTPTANVNIIATNTFRVAKNIDVLMQAGKQILGTNINIVSGKEEARLIYLGASNIAPYTQENRFVIDIGGGSTEFIIGKNYSPIICESLQIGCIPIYKKYFNEGIFTHSFERAILDVKKQLIKFSYAYKNIGWGQVLGTSGTARILAHLSNLLQGKDEYDTLSLQGLLNLKEYLIQCKTVDKIKFKKISNQRLEVLPSGLSIMLAIFEEFGLESMHVCDGGLRFGGLYDFIDVEQHDDIREISVNSLFYKFSNNINNISLKYGNCLFAKHVEYFASQLNIKELNLEDYKILTWAAKLYNIGEFISNSATHKHSAYIIKHADMYGFYKHKQEQLANLVLAQKGSLTKDNKLDKSFINLHMHSIICMRLAFLSNKHNIISNNDKNSLDISYIHQTKVYNINYNSNSNSNSNSNCNDTNQLLLSDLIEEKKYWKKANMNIQINIQNSKHILNHEY